MKGKTLKMILASIMVLTLGMPCFAATSKTINVTAFVPTISGGLNVTISKIRSSDDFWEQSGPTLPIDFGTLTLDTTYNVFRATYYYAVDVGVNDNTGTIWTVTHTRNSFKKDASNNLDTNVNVTFMKQTSSTSGSQLLKVSYASSNNVAYTKTQLLGGWLRIYYGIGTGSGDASGVLPIGLDKPTGTYSGSVVITLTP